MKPNKLPAGYWRNPVHLTACGFGTGAAAYAPGTWGTLVGIPFYIAMSGLNWPLYLLICVVMYFLGVWLCGQTAKDFNVHDHPGIVWDEVVGYLITMIAVPFEWHWVVLGFILFRIFDIAKPWPIKVIDKRVDGGTGIMLDDVLAGLLALSIMHIIIKFL